MPFYSSQVTLWPDTNILADVVMNTWGFETNDEDVLEEVSDQLGTFYNSISSWLSGTLRDAGHTIKHYDMADPKPRAARLETTFDFTSGPAGEPLPLEVCLCMSFQGVPLSGQPQARRRGRVYIGPLDSSCLGNGGRPSSGVVAGIAAAGQVLLDASQGNLNWLWGINSSYTQEGINFVEVNNGWVDNEFDTQRRRGRPADARTTFAI